MSGPISSSSISGTILAAVLVAVAIAGIALLNPAHNAREDVAFLERLAVTVERAERIPADTRDYLTKVAGRHEAPLADSQLDMKRREALIRIKAAMRASP
ncbi:MAG: hypothetical protein IT537_19720 [Hyphomicrobiales bacterium]|nr:hypothetical protein [Hyphomicrobiales bacterium]